MPCGVGMAQSAKLIPTLETMHKAGLIKNATTRDTLARDFLLQANIESKIFLDPAFHAYSKNSKEDSLDKNHKKFDLILNYRPKGGNGKFSNELDSYYLKIYKRLKNRISIITVHEPTEYILAKNIFPNTSVFYSSNASSYEAIYGSCRGYIGGRIHGCIPAVSKGAEAHIYYERIKVDVIKQAIRIFKENCNYSPIFLYSDPNKFSECDPSSEMARPEIIKEMERDLAAHKAYFQ